MQTLVTGSSTERIIRASITMLVVCGFAAAFLWDGYWGYPRDNARNLLTTLGMEANPDLPVRKELTATLGKQIAEEFKAGDRFSQIVKKIGEPTFEKNRDAYFVGPGGNLAVRRQETNSAPASRIENIVWVTGTHSDVDLMVQILLGYTLSIFGVFTLYRWIRTFTFRVTLSEEGLSGLTRMPIPFTEMRGFVEDGRKIPELEYERHGANHSLRLDPYDIKDASSIIEAISLRLNCSNPLESKETPSNA